MPPDLLERIARFLNVHPDYLAGIYDEKADRIEDAYLRHMYLKRVKPENYPYLLKAREDIDYSRYFEDILTMNNISMEQFKTLDPVERVLFRQELVLAILEVIAKHFKVDSLGRDIARSRKSGLKNIHLKNRRNNEVPPNQSHRLGGTFRYSFCFGQILGSTSRKCRPIFSGSISFASQMKRMVSGNRMWPFAFSSLYFIHSSYSLFVICFMLPPPYNKNSRDTPTYPSNANLPLKRQNRRRNN